jgi:hypothetical protein
MSFAGTGSPATVLRLGEKPGDKPFTLFESRDLSIQALRFGPDGSLYAATVPGGKVYKLNPDATAKQDESDATVVFDAAKADDASSGDSKPASSPSGQSHYIWDLTFDSAGRLYIATGNPGAVYRVDPAKSRRGARAVLQERRGAYPHAGVGREGQSDRWLGRLRPGLPDR